MLSSSPDRVAPQALAFAIPMSCRAASRQRRRAFIRHPLELARLPRDAGCSEAVVCAGLLHDIVEDGDVGLPELAERFVGGDAALLFAAGSISQVRDWPRRAGRQMARLDDLPADSRARREHHQALRLEHYRATLKMLERLAPGHALVAMLDDELRAV